MNWCVRAAPSLLLHVNILIVLYAGAGLATGARLKWDPSAYVPLREVFPREYALAACALPAAAAALLLLAHFALLALRTRRLALRRALLITYAVLMATAACGEAAVVWWLGARAAAWLRSERARQLHEALALREHVEPLLEHLARWHPLPTKLKALIQEAEEDLPRYARVVVVAGALLALLQAGAVVLALLTAAASRSSRARRLRAPSADTDVTPISTLTDIERTPLKAVYRNGKLMMV